MINNIDSEIIFTCDFCADESDSYPNDPDSDDFRVALESIKNNGWILGKDGDDWMHFCCRECKTEYFK